MSETPNLTMLGEAESGAAFVKDTSADVEVEDFDFDAFLAGVRSTRRSTKVYARADLVATMEELAQAYEDSTVAAERTRIINEFDKARDDFHASGRWFTVEKRSGEWVEKFRADTAKRLGLNLGDGEDDKGDPDAQMTALLHQLAEQVVVPSGVTYEGLRRLYDVNEGELNKLIVAGAMANQQQAESAKVVSPGFSLRPSAKKPATGSSKR